MKTSSFRKAVPALITLTNMFLGLCSVVFASLGDFHWAGWLILFGALLDKVDGIAARALDASSAVGMQLDSFSDMTTFGIAPAALFWYWSSASGFGAWWVGVACLLYVVCATIRLARFNVLTHGDTRYFSGVPTTFSATIFGALFLYMWKLELTSWMQVVLPSVLFALAALMISSIRIPKLRLPAHPWGVAMYAGVTLIVLVCLIWQVMPEILLLISLGYLLIGGFCARAGCPQE